MFTILSFIAGVAVGYFAKDAIAALIAKVRGATTA